MKNLYRQNQASYYKKNLPVIPDRYKGKTPLIKGWSDYCYKIPSVAESNQWSKSFNESNISICLGERAKIVALDLDTVRQDILDIIIPMLPTSPITKRGAKGETRFFRYMGEHTQKITFDGECIIEILSNGKKTTIPPSVHPNGMQYTWGNNNTLLNYDLSTLPLLPPMLFSHIESTLRSQLKEVNINKNKIVTSGRNNDMVSLCGKMISDRVDLNTAIKTLIGRDKEVNNPPLFSDPEEYRHTEPYTNALSLYTSLLNTINTKHCRDNGSYEVPIMPAPVSGSLKELERVGKTTKTGKNKKVKFRICRFCNKEV